MKIFKVFVLAILLGCAGSARATVWNVGDLTTYAQASWGGDSVGNPPFTDPDPGAALLVAQFNTVYGATFGVTAGSFSGFTMSFTDATSVLAYMPSIGTFAPLNGNVLNPISTASGGFGGETLGLEFNVDFSDAGFLPGTSGLHFGDLILANLNGAQAPLNGLTVRQLLGDTNILLSGGTSVITIADLGTLVGEVNGSFFEGTPNQFAQDHLVAPEITSETPLPAALPLFVTGLGALGLIARRRKRNAMVWGVIFASAMIATPAIGVAKNSGGNNGGAAVNHKSEVVKSNSTSTGVTRPKNPKGKSGGTTSDIKGESIDVKHKGDIHIESWGTQKPPPPPPPPQN